MKRKYTITSGKIRIRRTISVPKHCIYQRDVVLDAIAELYKDRLMDFIHCLGERARSKQQQFLLCLQRIPRLKRGSPLPRYSCI